MANFHLPESTDVNDFLTEQEPQYNWLIPDIMERGDRLILTGSEGHGKSTLLRQWAIQCSMGLHPFTLQDMEPLKVALVDLENPRSHLRREVGKLKQGLPIDPYFLSISSWPGGLDLLNRDYRIALTERLVELAPDLVVMGPMYKMAPHLETEEASAELAAFLDLIRSAGNFALIMESHQPHEVFTQKARFRPERPFGSSLWMRWPEFGICLENDGTLRHWRGARDERAWPTKLKRSEPWLWVPDARACDHCGTELTGRQESYCSDRCSNAARQRKFRAKGGRQNLELRLEE